MSQIKSQFDRLQSELHEAYSKKAALSRELDKTHDDINAIQVAIHEVVEKIQIEQALVETLQDELQEAEDELHVAKHGYEASKAHVAGLKGQLEAVLTKRGFEDRGDFMVGPVGTDSGNYSVSGVVCGDSVSISIKRIELDAFFAELIKDAK